jgi:hypothetical protein
MKIYAFSVKIIPSEIRNLTSVYLFIRGVNFKFLE